MYGFYYLMFATFPQLFTDIYGFDVGVGGLAYIGLGVGFFAATLFGAKISNRIYTRVRLHPFGSLSVATDTGYSSCSWLMQMEARVSLK